MSGGLAGGIPGGLPGGLPGRLAEDSAAPEPLGGAGRPLRVLLVEDEDSIALALGFLLTLDGYVHERIAHGGAALERLHAMRPDLVILDVMLPGMTGHELCRALRREPEFLRLPVLMMTARGAADERRRALDAGADGFIAKPFDVAELRGEIRRLLGGGAERGRGREDG